MKKKTCKHAAKAAIVSLGTLALAACGSGSAENPPASPNTSSGGASSRNATPPKEVKLKIGLPGGYDVTNKAIVDGFIAKFPHIKTEIQEAPWGSFTTKITAEIAGGTAPDIWFQENAVILGYGKRGVAEDLSAYIDRDLNESDYIAGLFTAKTPEGRVYGIPHGINPVALAFNKQIFTDANVPFPTDDWTYADLIETARKLTKDTNGDGKTDQYGFSASQSITQGWYPWVRSHGGQALDDTLTKAMFAEPKSVKGIAAWANLVKEGVSPADDYLKVAGGDWKVFGSGEAAMFFMQYSLQVLLKNNFEALDYDTVMMPKGTDGKRIVPMVTNSWLIFSKAKRESKEAAWEFLKYYLSEEVQNILAASGASIPVHKNAMTKLDETANPKNKKAFSDGIAQSGVTTDENASWQEWRTAAQPVFAEIYTQKVSPEEGMKQIQQKVQDVLDQNR